MLHVSTYTHIHTHTHSESLTMDRNDESLIYARAVLFTTAARRKNYTREVINLRYFIRCTSPMQVGETGVRTARGKMPINRLANSSRRAIAKYEIVDRDSPFSARVNNVIIIMRHSINFLRSKQSSLFLKFLHFFHLDYKAQHLIIFIQFCNPF